MRKSTSLEEDKLDEYTETLLKIFDSNKDGKLQLSEMTKLVLNEMKRLYYTTFFLTSFLLLIKRVI